MRSLTRQQVRHQARLMGRTLAHLAMKPSDGHHLPDLLRTRARTTMDLRVPWLPFRLIEDLEKKIVPGTRVFEYGGGGSTLWFLDRGANVTTVEHQPSWGAKLAAEVDHPWWNLIECRGEDFAEYVAAIGNCAKDSLDIVVVDGRERVRCAHEALVYVKPGGWLIVDDVDRDRYRRGLSTIDWARREIVGFAPAKPSLAYSAVFVKPGSGE